jgi:uncharacterized protein (DUF1810 family)
MTEDPFNLNRFVDAQESIYSIALSELRAGQKRSHWMWFIFPQIAGLGQSQTASFYAIKNASEAEAYLDHAVLGRRLKECTRTLLNFSGRSASDIFAYPDDLKFCSSMTLFDHVSSGEPVFSDAITKYCGGMLDMKTLDILTR